MKSSTLRKPAAKQPRAKGKTGTSAEGSPVGVPAVEAAEVLAKSAAAAASKASAKRKERTHGKGKDTSAQEADSQPIRLRSRRRTEAAAGFAILPGGKEMTTLGGPKREASRGPLRIVAIGGGSGLSTLLKGLKYYAVPIGTDAMPIAKLTAVVTVTDDGGSSGRLRRDFDVLPPGDIRNCLVALSADETLLGKLFQYRFSRGRGLRGHSLGNLFLTALTHLTGDFATSVRFASEVLACRGEIFPSTAENVTLEARMANGKVIKGESKITATPEAIREIRVLPRRPKPFAETLQAIADADLITMGPGSLFTSLVPNLLVDGISRAILESRAVKLFIGNLMCQPGETEHFSASDHVRAVLRHTGLHGDDRQRFLDYILLNSQSISPRQLGQYAATDSLPVENDVLELRSLGLEIVKAPLLASHEKVRHDSRLTADLVIKLARLGRRRRTILTGKVGGKAPREKELALAAGSLLVRT